MAPQNPLTRAGCFSRLLFLWVNPLLKAGWKGGGLCEDDLYELEEQDASATVAALLRSAWHAELRAHGDTASLARAYRAAFMAPYIRNSAPALLKSAFVLGTTQVLGALLDELRKPTPSVPVAYGLAAGLVATVGGAALLHHVFFIDAWRAGARWRAATLQLIYEKSLVLELAALSAISAGHVVSMAATDLERFQKACQYLTYVVVAPLEAVVIFGLLWRELGWAAAIASLATMATFVALQGGLSYLFGRLRSSTARFSDERVRLTGQVVAGIRVIKSQGWEPPLAAAVLRVRDREMRLIASAAMLRATNEGIFTAAPFVIGAVTFLVAWGAPAGGGALTPRSVFVSSLLMQSLQVRRRAARELVLACSSLDTLAPLILLRTVRRR